MARVFRLDEHHTSPLLGSFSLLVFETNDPEETATRVFESGVVSAFTGGWRLKEMPPLRRFFEPSWPGYGHWYEVTKQPEVQEALKATEHLCQRN